MWEKLPLTVISMYKLPKRNAKCWSFAKVKLLWTDSETGNNFQMVMIILLKLFHTHWYEQNLAPGMAKWYLRQSSKLGKSETDPNTWNKWNILFEFCGNLTIRFESYRIASWHMSWVPLKKKVCHKLEIICNTASRCRGPFCFYNILSVTHYVLAYMLHWLCL